MEYSSRLSLRFVLLLSGACCVENLCVHTAVHEEVKHTYAAVLDGAPSCVGTLDSERDAVFI
jgi:hypothetical protein